MSSWKPISEKDRYSRTEANTKLRELLNQVQSAADFGYVAFESINDTNALGDNALHCVCVWGDMEAAKLLVDNGIEINQYGEGGFTPLNVALDFEHRELADYLIAKGADTGVIGAKEQFDRDKYNLHMRCLSDGIEALKQQIQEECGSAQQGAPADVEPPRRSICAKLAQMCPPLGHAPKLER